MKNLILFTLSVGLLLSLESQASSTKLKGELTGHSQSKPVSKKKLSHLDLLRQSLQGSTGSFRI